MKGHKFLALITTAIVAMTGCKVEQSVSIETSPDVEPTPKCSIYVDPPDVYVGTIKTGDVVPLGKTITVKHGCDATVTVEIVESNPEGSATMAAPGEENEQKTLGPGDVASIDANIQAGAPGPFEVVCDVISVLVSEGYDLDVNSGQLRVNGEAY